MLWKNFGICSQSQFIYDFDLFYCLFISTWSTQHQELHQGTNQQELIQIAEYYFDGQGKALRPMVTMLMGKAINYHMHRENRFVKHPANVFHPQNMFDLKSSALQTIKPREDFFNNRFIFCLRFEHDFRHICSHSIHFQNTRWPKTFFIAFQSMDECLLSLHQHKRFNSELIWIFLR